MPPINTAACVTLTEWCATAGRSQRRLAALLTARGLPTSQQTVCRWCSGEDRPAEAKRSLLRRITGIEEFDWYTSAEQERLAAMASRRRTRRRPSRSVSAPAAAQGAKR